MTSSSYSCVIEKSQKQVTDNISFPYFDMVNERILSRRFLTDGCFLFTYAITSSKEFEKNAEERDSDRTDPI
jgi:hypothetical protein